MLDQYQLRDGECGCLGHENGFGTHQIPSSSYEESVSTSTSQLPANQTEGSNHTSMSSSRGNTPLGVQILHPRHYQDIASC